MKRPAFAGGREMIGRDRIGLGHFDSTGERHEDLGDLLFLFVTSLAIFSVTRGGGGWTNLVVANAVVGAGSRNPTLSVATL